MESHDSPLQWYVICLCELQAGLFFLHCASPRYPWGARGASQSGNMPKLLGLK